MPEDSTTRARINPDHLTREFGRIYAISNDLERNLELAQLCHSTASQHAIDATTIQNLYEDYLREKVTPPFARPLLKASRRLRTTQEALKNIALISVIASAISFFSSQNEARMIFIQKQWELAENGPKIGPIRKSAIEILATKGFNLGRLQAQNTFLASLRLPQQTRLQGAKFNSSNLYGSSLIKANLYFADFSKYPNGNHTNLENTNLSGSDLREASFKGAYMKKACLRGANLEKARLDNAVLTGADFRGARNLTASQLSKAIYPKDALYDPDLAQAIGASVPSDPDAEPASCRLTAKQSNLFSWLLGALH